MSWYRSPRAFSTSRPGGASDLAEDIDNGRYPGDDSTVVSNAAGMEHIIHAAQARGIDTRVLAAAQTIADRAIENGFASVIEVLGPKQAARKALVENSRDG